MSKISELPNALESVLNYINEVGKKLEEDSILDDVSMLRGDYNVHTIMDNFLDKITYLKDEIVNKVIYEAKDVVDVNKEVLTDMVKVFKDIGNKVNNGAQIVNIVEVTNNMVQYTNMTLNNIYKKDRNYQKEADLIFKKIKNDISHGENILRHNNKEKANLRRYLNEINQQTNSLESDIKVVVQKAKEIKRAMVEIIKWKTMLEDKFNNTKVHINN